jgi:hypothetical protein
MALYINADSGLMLATSFDAPEEEWTEKIDFLDLVDASTPLKPVTWSSVRNGFCSVTYGFDGRMTEDWIILNDEANANGSDSSGYYVKGTFYARSEQTVAVSLADAVEVNDGENGSGTYVIGTPLWNDQTILHEDGGNGAECAIRIGFRITYLTETGETDTAAGEDFYIYEPNCDRHISGAVGYIPTKSIDGQDTLVEEDHLILQTASSWSETYPVQREVTIKSLGQFESNTTLFSLEKGRTARIDLYIWLEGQDVDCVSLIDEAQIFASIQFHGDYSGQSGLQPIS